MRGTQLLAARFNGLSVIRQSCLIVALAVIAADLLTLLFYSIFFSERLALDLVLTSLIVIVVAFPLSYLFMWRSSKLSELADELARTNRIDDLTGLLNRKTFLVEANELIFSADRNSAGTLLFIDVDHFKSVNDTYGHAIGDAALREIGAVLATSVQDKDLAGRLGGEEFAVFLAGQKYVQASQICELIRLRSKTVCETIGLPSHEITVSIGVAKHHSGQGLDELLVAADRNLYLAKSRGRDRAVFQLAKEAVA